MRSLLQTNIISIKGVAGKAVVKITATAFATFDLSSDKNHPGQMQCNACVLLLSQGLNCFPSLT